MNWAEKNKTRPKVVNLAIGILLLNAGILIFWWILLPQDVVSHGSQVFFITTWFLFAGMLFVGEGWVRYALIAFLLLCGAAWYNTMGFNTDSVGLIITKLLVVPVTLLTFLPASHRWFRDVYLAKVEENQREKRDTKVTAT